MIENTEYYVERIASGRMTAEQAYIDADSAMKYYAEGYPISDEDLAELTRAWNFLAHMVARKVTEQANVNNDREVFARAVQEAFIRKFDRELADPEVAIDVPTGTELRPGDPENCLGGDNHPEYPLCCDGCDHLEDCFTR